MEPLRSGLLPLDLVEATLATYGVAGVSLAVLVPDGDGDARVRTQVAGLADRGKGMPVYDSTCFEIASLSKPIAATFACQYFAARGIAMETPTNQLLEDAGSPFRIKSSKGLPPEWGQEVSLRMLLDHTGVGMHYVNGVPLSHEFPSVLSLISGSEEAPAPYGYASLDLRRQPGTKFAYSGGGFLILQHILESREGKPIAEIMEPFLAGCGTAVSLGLSFWPILPGKLYAEGYRDDRERVPGGRLNFPPLAAGALGTPAALLDWLRQLAVAYRRPEGCGSITHDAARQVLGSRPDRGSEAFMRSRMGVGMFVFDVASPQGVPNRWMVHQAANDGFRGVLLVCFDGPDAARGPRGFVCIVNGDNQGMLAVAAISRAILQSNDAFSPPLQGLDFSRVPSMEGGFSTEGLKQEEIVNLGLKDLLLAAFVPPACETGSSDEMAERTQRAE